MAKTSSIEKNKRRARMAKRFAGRRAKLKKIAHDKNVSMEERFAATLKLAELPRNSAKIRVRNRFQPATAAGKPLRQPAPPVVLLDRTLLRHSVLLGVRV